MRLTESYFATVALWQNLKESFLLKLGYVLQKLVPLACATLLVEYPFQVSQYLFAMLAHKLGPEKSDQRVIEKLGPQLSIVVQKDA